MRILCYVNHFFGQNPDFQGKSSLPVKVSKEDFEKKSEARKLLVEQTIANLRQMEGIDLKVCGIEGYSLVPLDLNFDKIREKPLWLIYESLNHMANFIDEYDYFVNIEDDILLPGETFLNIVEFDRVSLANEILFPNRLEETKNGERYCVDLKAIPGWTQQQRVFRKRKFRVAVNPHSGILVLSKEKFSYALQFVDREFREPFLYNELDSAFAYFHAPFALYRSEDLDFHYVRHLDNWLYSKGETNYESVWQYRLKSIKAMDFIPPIMLRLFLYLKRKISMN